jgi:cell division protein FtsQ
MAAALRGGSPSRARGRVRPKVAQPPRRAPKPAKAGKSKPYAPAKLAAAQSLGLAPLTAVSLAGLIALIGVVAVLATDPRVHRMRDQVVANIDNGLIGLGLRVADVQVQGATPAAAADILKAAALGKNQPILHLDLNALRGRVESVGWVKSAKVIRLLPDTVVIAVTQRQTMAVWQHAGRNLVIDSEGRAIPEADPGQFTDLPLVVGEGADKRANEIISALTATPELSGRVKGATLVSQRRWNLTLDNSVVVRLPEEDMPEALKSLAGLERDAKVLEKDILAVDMRMPDRATFRLSEQAAAARADALAKKKGNKV